MSRKRKPEPKVAVAKKKPPRWQREHNISRFLWIFIPLVLVVLFALVGYWAYDNYVAVWHKPVARVSATTIDMNYYVKMLRFYSAVWRVNVDELSFPYQVLQAIEENEIIRQEANRLGLTVPSDEVTATIAEAFPVEGQESPDTPDVTPTFQGNVTTPVAAGNSTSVADGNDTAPEGTGNSTVVETEIGESYNRFLDFVRISDNEYRRIVETSLLGQKVIDYFEEEKVPDTAEQVYLHFIPVDTIEKATAVSARARGGEDFATLAREFSVIDEIKEAGGDIGWVPRGVFPELDNEAFGREIGNVSDPISTSEGYYVLEVTAIDNDREVAEEYKPALAKGEFEKWLQEQMKESVEEYIDQSKINWALEHI